MTEQEGWRDIPGFEGKCQASNRGRLRSLDYVVSARCRWGQMVRTVQMMAGIPDASEACRKICKLVDVFLEAK